MANILYPKVWQTPPRPASSRTRKTDAPVDVTLIERERAARERRIAAEEEHWMVLSEEPG